MIVIGRAFDNCFKTAFPGVVEAFVLGLQLGPNYIIHEELD